MTGPSTDIAIVGGGASGVMLALQLLHQGGDALRVAIVERGPDAGPGLAYATRCPAHLLNTRAGDMSAFPDEPDHFVRWLAESGQAGDRHGFAPRAAYGDYLRSILADAARTFGHRLQIIRGEATSVSQEADCMRLGIMGREQVTCRSLVLATGHRPPSADQGVCRGDPWAPGLLDDLDAAASVLLIGTGLTMIDVVVSLNSSGFKGRIVAVSRRGLVPRCHGDHVHAAGPGLVEPLFSGSLSSRLRRFRTLSGTVGSWASVMQALRPRNRELWRSLDEPERRRFLRHLRPWWDVHRHRVAPEAFAVLQDARDGGQTTVIAGRVQVMDQQNGRVRAAITRRGHAMPEILIFDRVIDCRGPVNSIDVSGALDGQMHAQGLLRPDALNLGVAVDDDDAVLTQAGKPTAWIYALGPPTRGRHWEITAIPDIRSRATKLARRILSRLAV